MRHEAVHPIQARGVRDAPVVHGRFILRWAGAGGGIGHISHMTSSAPKIRLYVECDLAAGADAPLSRDQAHYLANVMRVKPGDEVALFNGRDGEWRAEIAALGSGRVSKFKRVCAVFNRGSHRLRLGVASGR